MKGYVDWQTFRRWECYPNILERDFQLKLAMGFSAESFARIWDILRPRPDFATAGRLKNRVAWSGGDAATRGISNLIQT